MNLTHNAAAPAIVRISAAAALAVLALLLWRCYGGQDSGDMIAAATCLTFTGLLVSRAAGAGIFGDAR